MFVNISRLMKILLCGLKLNGIQYSADEINLFTKFMVELFTPVLLSELIYSMLLNLNFLIRNSKNYHISTNLMSKPLQLYKFLLRECEKLPEAPQKHYKFMVKQSFKQHVKETDQERIKQITSRAYEDAEWILKKYLPKKN